MEAFIYDYTPLLWLSDKYRVCDLKILKDDLFTAQDSFAVSKSFAWTKQVNNAILYYREREIIPKLQKKWISNKCEDDMWVERLHIYDFGGLIIILCVTVATCFILLIPEHIYDKYLCEKSLYHQNET